MGVTVNRAEVDKRLSFLTRNLGTRGLNKLGSEAKSLLLADARKAYSSGTAPSGQTWKPRKYPKPWPLLNQTGTSERALDTKYVVHGSRLTVMGRVNSAMRIDRRKKPWNVAAVVGVHHYGAPHQVRRPIFGISSRTSQKVKETARGLVRG